PRAPASWSGDDRTHAKISGPCCVTARYRGRSCLGPEQRYPRYALLPLEEELLPCGASTFEAASSMVNPRTEACAFRPGTCQSRILPARARAFMVLFGQTEGFAWKPGTHSPRSPVAPPPH